jgi:hypothetical protein
LCNHHNPKNGCFPKQETLAGECGVSRASLNTHLNHLEGLGLIRRVQRFDEVTRKQRSTLYYFPFEYSTIDIPSPESGHGMPEPTLESEGSRVQNPDTNLGNYPVTTYSGDWEELKRVEEKCLSVCGEGLSSAGHAAIVKTTSVIAVWLARGDDLDLDILPVIQSRTRMKRSTPIRTWAYFDRAIKERRVRRLSEKGGAQQREAVRSIKEGFPPGVLEQMARWVIGANYLAPNAVTNTMRDALLRAGLVTPEQLRKRQIY